MKKGMYLVYQSIERRVVFFVELPISHSDRCFWALRNAGRRNLQKSIYSGTVSYISNVSYSTSNLKVSFLVNSGNIGQLVAKNESGQWTSFLKKSNFSNSVVGAPSSGASFPSTISSLLLPLLTTFFTFSTTWHHL